MFKYEKSSIEQQHQVSKILGPPENRETTGKRSNAEVSENELESLLPTDLEFEVSDDVLSNMPLPDYCTNGIENFSRCALPLLFVIADVSYVIPYGTPPTKKNP